MSTYHDGYVYFSNNGTLVPVDSPKAYERGYYPFYISLALGVLFLTALFALNIICSCSRYSDYWLDNFTGNRWILSLWTATPHKQPPLDLKELEAQFQSELAKPFVEYHHIHKEDAQVTLSISKQPLTYSQDYLELEKRESEI